MPIHRRVFYSWQSDLDENRRLVELALGDACKAIGQSPTVESRPEVEQDARGIPGSPDITKVVFDRIGAADVFVGDITTINSGGSLMGQRPVPNPNVGVEAGYALCVLGAERVLLVFNEAMGNPNGVPFDIRQHRRVMYSCDFQTRSAEDARCELAEKLERALDSIFKEIERVESNVVKWGYAPLGDAPPNEIIDQLTLESRFTNGQWEVEEQLKGPENAHLYLAHPESFGDVKLILSGFPVPCTYVARNVPVATQCGLEVPYGLIRSTNRHSWDGAIAFTARFHSLRQWK